MRGHVAQMGDLARPRAVYGVLLNFRNELEMLGETVHQAPYKAPPKAPVMYVKPANTWSVSGDAIALPAGEAALQPGVSLGVVFNRAATRVTEQAAFESVAGYIVINDIRLPHNSFYRPAIKQLCRDGFCVIGEDLVSAAPFKDRALKLRAYVNDRLEQEASTADLVRSVPRLIAEITQFMSLDSGDILMIGVPAGRPNAKAGDRIKVEVEGVGCLQNQVVSEVVRGSTRS